MRHKKFKFNSSVIDKGIFMCYNETGYTKQIDYCRADMIQKQKAWFKPNVIKIRKEPSSGMSLALFLRKKVEEFLEKDLTKNQKCAVDFISLLIKSTLVNRSKIHY